VLSGSVEFQMISAGGWHSCALTDAGDAYCWGWNIDGQLGDGTTNDQAEPTQVLAGGMRFQMIAAGHVHSCALTGAGDTYCWGLRWNDTRDPEDPVPTPVPVTVAW
jgi:alpha-tubulin suppressor-like RCC1 family protein